MANSCENIALDMKTTEYVIVCFIDTILKSHAHTHSLDQSMSQEKLPSIDLTEQLFFVAFSQVSQEKAKVFYNMISMYVALVFSIYYCWSE